MADGKGIDHERQSLCRLLADDKELADGKAFAISLFFVVCFTKVDGKEPLCHQLADDKELADGKMSDSSSEKGIPIIVVISTPLL